MAIVGMSGENTKKVEPVEQIRPDDTWYNASLCKKCPYLEMDDVAQMARCHKPYGEECLGQALLVQASIMREHYNRMVSQMDEVDVKLTAGIDDCVKEQPSQKPFISRRKKPIKNRRG